MKSVRIIAAIVVLNLALFGGGPSFVAAQSEVTTYTPDRIEWEELYYKASKMGVKAESRVKVRLLPASEAAKGLIEANNGTAVAVGSGQVAEIQLDNSVKGTDSVSTLLLRAEDAAAFQRTQVTRTKKKNFLRTYRYLTDGVFIERRIPEGAPTGSPWDWPVHNTRTMPFPSDINGKSVTEGMALFYILSAADFSAVGDTLRFYNFDRDGMSQVLMTVEEIVDWKVNYTEVSSQGERQVKETRQVARLTVSGESVGDGDEAFEFLGMKGNIEIFADPELRIPVAVKGKVPVAGNTTVQINRVVRR